MPVSTAMVPVTAVSTINMVTLGKVITFGCGMTCGKVGKDGPAVGVEGLDGEMSEQALEGNFS
jgi:hypothetical protein